MQQTLNRILEILSGIAPFEWAGSALLVIGLYLLLIGLRRTYWFFNYTPPERGEPGWPVEAMLRPTHPMERKMPWLFCLVLSYLCLGPAVLFFLVID